MGKVDQGVAIPVWNAYFRAGMEQFGNDAEKATDYADKLVRQTQGSGREVDLPQIMAGHGAWGQLKKVFTMFHSYFNGQLGLLVTTGAVSAHEAKTNPTLASAKFAAKFLAIVAIPTILTELLMHGIDDKDRDPEYFAKHWFKIFAMYGAAMFPLIRDLAGGVASYYSPDTKHNAGVKLSPVESTAESAIKTPKSLYDIMTDHGDDTDAKNAIMGTSFVLGLPGKLISDAVMGTKAWIEGKTGPQGVVLGPPPKR
jgi:hypothetical protein